MSCKYLIRIGGRGERVRRLTGIAIFGWAALGATDRTFAEDPPANEPVVVESEPSRPPIDQVAATIQQHFLGLKDYEPGDLISRSEVQAALNRVVELGWNVPNRATLEKLVLPDGAFLVSQLRTKSGKRFMRKIAGYPGGYDRLDRLSGISGGRRLVKDLARGKGGHELIEYLTTSQGGANLGQMLTHGKGGRDFNKPTGRIYTVDVLVKAVEKVYREQSDTENEVELP